MASDHLCNDVNSRRHCSLQPSAACVSNYFVNEDEKKVTLACVCVGQLGSNNGGRKLKPGSFRIICQCYHYYLRQVVV